MKIISFVCLLFLLTSCGKDQCKKCASVVYSDERRNCGRENNGKDRFSETALGEFCDNEEIELVRKSIEEEHRLLSSCGSQVRYTLMVRMECN